MAKKKKPLTPKQKERKVEHEIDTLVARISSGETQTLMDKVGWVLNHFPSARDSDVTCLIRFWQTFEPDIINNGVIKVSDLYKYTRLTSVVRARAKIQNEYKLFLATEEVRKHRGTLDEEYKNWAVEERQDCGQYAVYVDESGKTDAFLILGSVWIIDGFATLELFRELIELKKKNRDQEFHFASISKATESVYIELIDLVYKHSSALSIKFNYISKEGINVQDALKDMLYHLIIDGIKHENSTARAPLPRSIQLIKDLEAKGADQLLLKNTKEKLTIAAKTIFEDKLYIDEFRALDSKTSPYLQIADVVVASINRKLNSPGQTTNSKDRVADHLFKLFNLDIEEGRVVTLGDLSSEMSM